MDPHTTFSTAHSWLSAATDVRLLPRRKAFHGFGERVVYATHIGNYKGFSDVYFSDDASANLLSFGMLHDTGYWNA